MDKANGIVIQPKLFTQKIILKVSESNELSWFDVSRHFLQLAPCRRMRRLNQFLDTHLLHLDLYMHAINQIIELYSLYMFLLFYEMYR